MIRRPHLVLAAALVIAVAACSPSESPAPSASPSASGEASPGASGSPSATAATTTIRVQLAGPVDGEFAGLIAAQKLGYFGDVGLTVTLIPGDADPSKRPSGFYNPGTTGPEFTISDVASVLSAREHEGSDLVDIAQIFQRSGTVLLTWKKDAITTTCGLIGKKVGVWAAPADLEVVATLKTLASCPGAGTSNATRVDVGHDVSAFLAHQVDAIQADSYDQLAQVLEATNPATNQQYTPDDVTVLPLAAQTATLQDAVFASAAWLNATGNRDLAVSFVQAVVQGWIYCRDYQEDCVQFTTAAGTGLGTSHTRWVINGVNSLIWPSPSGIGALDRVQWGQTITVAVNGGAISGTAGKNAYDDTVVPEAVAVLTTMDLAAANYLMQPVLVAPGGK